jgi:hypothetical protein
MYDTTLLKILPANGKYRKILRPTTKLTKQNTNFLDDRDEKALASTKRSYQPSVPLGSV